MPAIGIDLGTTNCCVGVLKNNQIQIVPNKLTKRITPSILSFENNDVIVGLPALRPENVAQGMKYIIGRSMADPVVKRFMEDTKMSVINAHHYLKVAMKRRDKEELFMPEEICAFILHQLKLDATAFMDCEINSAVITVPTYFNSLQRQATIDAGKIAGFEHVMLLNEATAAAIAYGAENKTAQEKMILVYDFGGGTFDVTVLKYVDNRFKVVAVDGDLQLGGENITNNLKNKIIKLVRKDFKIDLSNDRRNLLRLKHICENAKIELSVKDEVSLDLSFVNEDAFYDITRKDFEVLNSELFGRTMTILRNCLRSANLHKSSIDEVILIGGSTCNSVIGRMLESYFARPVKSSISKEEAVAHGAAIVAAKWRNEYPEELLFQNLTPHSLGVELNGGKMDFLIPRYSELPAKKSSKYKTLNAAQTKIKVKIFSGENELSKYNTFLGSFLVSGIKSGPDGNILEETFTVNENGILEVAAVDLSGKSTKLKLNIDNGRLNHDMIIAAKKRLQNILKEPKPTRQPSIRGRLFR